MKIFVRSVARTAGFGSETFAAILDVMPSRIPIISPEVRMSPSVRSRLILAITTPA
jgi:hypothetical protein